MVPVIDRLTLNELVAETISESVIVSETLSLSVIESDVDPVRSSVRLTLSDNVRL